MNPQTFTARTILMQEAVKPRTDYARRECLEHVYCDGEYIAATNGQILVFSPAEGLEKGYYDIAVSGSGKNRRTTFIPVKLDAAFPNWKLVVPMMLKSPMKPCLTLEAISRLMRFSGFNSNWQP